MKFHPISDMFPMMSEQEFAGLLADIREHGLREVILVSEDDQIIDGRNRFRACQELKIEPRFRTIQANGSLTHFVISMNLHRRHLDASQKAAVALAIERELAKEAKQRQLAAQNNKSGRAVREKIPQLGNGRARDQAAAVVGVNPRYISTLKATAARAPELEVQVRDGRLSVKEARRLAEISADQRESVLARVGAGEKFGTAISEVFRESLANIAPMKDPEGCTLLHGDCLECAQEIAEESMDAIITDPPYSKDFMPVFSKLAQVALRCLKPGGSLILMPGNMYMPQVIAALNVEGLNFQWTFAYMTPGPKARAHARRVLSSWKPLLWYVKGKYNGDYVSDVIMSKGSEKRFHKWGQSESGFAAIVERFTRPGQTILDPFLGGGTTGVVALRLGRRFIGIEIEERTIVIARARMAERGRSNGAK